MKAKFFLKFPRFLSYTCSLLQYQIVSRAPLTQSTCSLVSSFLFKLAMILSVNVHCQPVHVVWKHSSVFVLFRSAGLSVFLFCVLMIVEVVVVGKLCLCVTCEWKRKRELYSVCDNCEDYIYIYIYYVCIYTIYVYIPYIFKIFPSYCNTKLKVKEIQAKQIPKHSLK